MKTIIAIASQDIWEQAQRIGEYTQSTLDSTLADVGFIHCSFPEGYNIVLWTGQRHLHHGLLEYLQSRHS